MMIEQKDRYKYDIPDLYLSRERAGSLSIMKAKGSKEIELRTKK